MPGRALARSVRRGGALLLAAVCASQAPAALEAFFKFSNLLGASPDPVLAKWSPVRAFSINFSVYTNPLTGVSTKTFGNLMLTKAVDRTSPNLMVNLFTGNSSPAANLYVRNAGESSPVFVFNLKSALLREYRVESDITQSGGALDETLALSYASLEMTVTRPDAASGLTSTSAAWNVSTNTLVTSAAPSLTLGSASVTTNEDTPVVTSFNISDDYSSLETLTLAATSSDASIVAPGGLVFSGTGSGRALTVTPVANASGTVTVSLKVTDTAGLSTTSSFTLTVNPVNDAPVVAAVAAQTTTVGVARSVTVTLSDVDNAATALSLTATIDNASVLPASGIVLSGTGATRTLTLTPAAAGSAVVTLTANDGTANSTPVTFTFIANAVGFGIPTDITLSANAVAENSANGTVIGALGVVDADNASGHTYALVDDAGGRFRLSGSSLVVNNGALLDYETATSHLITVRVTDPDNNTFSKQLTVTVTNVNEAPTVALGSLGAAAPGRALALTQVAFSDPDAGGADVRAEFSVLHGTLTCDTAGALSGKVTGNQTATLVITAPLADINAALAAGALTYVSAQGFIGEDIIQVVCSDLGHSGSGGALSDTRLAAIGVAVDSFAAWQALNFSADELADPSVSGPLAVLQPDGLTNLIKYALGLDPHAVAISGLPEMSQTATDWVFTYTRPASRPDLTYAVQFSADLSAWDLAGGTHELVSTDSVNHTETWRGTLPKASAPNLFVRLSVTRTTGP
jgi:type VI protein secretion system component Hcp